MEIKNSMILSYIRAAKVVQVEVREYTDGTKQFKAFYGDPADRKHVMVQSGGESESACIVKMWLQHNDKTKPSAVGRMSDRGAMEWAAMTVMAGDKMMLPIRNEIEATETTPLEAKR